MSADNPASTDETDKPAPPKPVPAETNGSAEVYDPDLDELADEALSEPPISYDDDPAPVPAESGSESQGTAPASSGSADGPDQSGQDGAGVAGAPAARDQGAPQAPAPEAAGGLEQAGNPPAVGETGGGAEVYDPDLDELADEALSEPPINYDEDPAPASGSQDGAAGPEAQEPAARQRTGREAQEQPAAPAPGREQAETGTEAGDKQGQQAGSSEQAAREISPVPQQDYSDVSQTPLGDADPPADAAAPGMAAPEVCGPTAATALPAETENVTEADNGQDNADTALAAAQAVDIPLTPTASSDGDLSGEQESPPAERPEDPAASLITTEAVTQEPGTAEPEPDENAQPEDPLATIAVEPGSEGDNDPGETTVVPEAKPAQVGTTERDPQTQDPEPETVLSSDGDGDPDDAGILLRAGDPDDEASLAAGDRLGGVPAVLGSENDPGEEGTTPQDPASMPPGEQSPTTGGAAEHNSGNGSEDGDGSGPKPPDGPGPGGDAGRQGGSKQPIRHITSEFHGKRLGMYTDGVNWKPEDVVQDALKKGAKEGKPKAPERHGITDFPQARDLGDNAMGEKPERSPGDTSDLPPTGAELLEMEPRGRSRMEKFRRRIEEEELLDDLQDTVHDQSDTVQQVLDSRQPQGHPVQVHGPVYEQVPVHAHLAAGDTASATLMAGLVVIEGGRRVYHMLTHKKETEQ